jgi:predicted transcriptional regulator
MGSKSRLKIIQELSDEPRYVSELAERIGMDGKSTVHHLQTLEEAGIVEYYETSQRKYYRLTQTVEFKVSPPPEGTFVLHKSDAETGDEEAVPIRTD